VRVGVVREYMSRALFSKADEQSIDLVERAISEVRKLGATIVDPGPEGALFQSCIPRYAPELLNSAFVRQYPQMFAGSDTIAMLLELHNNPASVTQSLSLRSLGGGVGAPGEGKYMINRYLQERGDASIKTNADLIAKARFYEDRNFPDRRQAREAAERSTELDSSGRIQTRFALQNMLLQCMQEQKLDALLSPMSTVPPRKLTAPREPTANGRSPIGWSMFGQQGFPVITVPAGFTTEVWDRVADGNAARLAGPVAAQIPVGVDFIGRPFDEPVLLRIASAYEAATRNRRPPSEFGPLPGEP
jgi:Asp-tRNA(Asn)/Glu-tRNA(Gln) amidotransferase A subunit family amidase